MDKLHRDPDKKYPRPPALGSMRHAMTDPQGMYTGVPTDPYEEPIQDADDL